MRNNIIKNGEFTYRGFTIKGEFTALLQYFLF